MQCPKNPPPFNSCSSPQSLLLRWLWVRQNPYITCTAAAQASLSMSAESSSIRGICGESPLVVIIAKGCAYASNGSVYFDTGAFRASGHDYPKLKVGLQAEASEAEMAEGEGALSSSFSDEKRYPPAHQGLQALTLSP
eukprot:1183707-Prorocentrum_minimum.AAC.4